MREQQANLFQRGDFTLASGRPSTWKIECDALTPEDWEGLAEMAAQTVLKGMEFRVVMGVPRGGVPFANAIDRLDGLGDTHKGKVLLCEDVVTTGGSIDRYRVSLGLHVEDVVGVCVFARGKCPPWIRSLFQMPEDSTLTAEEARAGGVCRLCRKTIRTAAGKYVSPKEVTFDFGREFAHTECLLADQSDVIRKERLRIIGILSDWVRPLDIVLPISLVKKIKEDTNA